MLTGTGRKLRPVQHADLGQGEPEDEVLRKPLDVAFHLLVQPLGCYAVETGEIGVENDALPAQDDERFRDRRRMLRVRNDFPHVRNNADIRAARSTRALRAAGFRRTRKNEKLSSPAAKRRSPPSCTARHGAK